jgi:hypothetical protein
VLELATGGAEDLHSVAARQITGHRQQSRLAGASRGLDDDGSANAFPRCAQDPFESCEFLLTLHEQAPEPVVSAAAPHWLGFQCRVISTTHNTLKLSV